MRDPSWAKTDDSGYDVDAFDATQINTAADVTVLGIDAGTTGQPSLKSYIERLDSGKKMNPCFGEQAPSKYDDLWTCTGRGKASVYALTAKVRATELKATYGEAAVAAVVAAASVSNADDVGHPHPLTLRGSKSFHDRCPNIFLSKKKAEKKRMSRLAVGIQKWRVKG